MSIPFDNRAGKWQRVTRSHPCPKYGKPDFCSLSADGMLAACRLIEAGAWKSKTDKARAPVYLHRLDGATPSPSAQLPPSTGGTVPDRADADTLHAVFSALLAAFSLGAAHRENLRSRALPEPEVDARGYGTLPLRGRARVAAELRQRFAEAVLGVPC